MKKEAMVRPSPPLVIEIRHPKRRPLVLAVKCDDGGEEAHGEEPEDRAGSRLPDRKITGHS